MTHFIEQDPSGAALISLAAMVILTVSTLFFMSQVLPGIKEDRRLRKKRKFEKGIRSVMRWRRPIYNRTKRTITMS